MMHHVGLTCNIRSDLMLLANEVVIDFLIISSPLVLLVCSIPSRKRVCIADMFKLICPYRVQTENDLTAGTSL